MTANSAALKLFSDLEARLKVLLWESGKYFYYIVLWDGEFTYWNEKMQPSGGYKKLKLNSVSPVTHGRFTLIGEL
jgi:hypothetical protein